MLLAYLLASLTLLAAAGQAELVERTLAIVAGQAITLSDVRTAQALGLTDAGADLGAATERLVERALMLREVARYLPPEPDAARLEARRAQIAARLPSGELARVLERGGFSEARLIAWLRDDLRIEAYVAQRFAAGDVGATRADLIADWVADLRRRTPVVELWKKQERR